MNDLRSISLNIILCIFAQQFCSAVEAQTWTYRQDIPNTPTSGRWGAISFSVGGKVYVGGGYKGNFTSLNDFWEYDPTTDQWTQKQNLPGAVNRTAGAGFSGNGKGYVCLGSANYNTVSAAFLADLWEYDPAADSWTQKSSLPDSGRHHAAVFVIGSKAYIAGGSTGYPYIASNDLWEYDMINDSWSSKASYPAVSINQAMGFAAGNKGYLVGGHVMHYNTTGNGTADSATYEYDPASNTWTRKSDFCGRRKCGIAFSLNDMGYVGLGMADFATNTIYYEEFCRYDPVGDSWTPAASYPGIARAYAVAAVANGKAYAGGGWLFVSSEMYHKDWAEFDAGDVGIAPIAGLQPSVYPNPASTHLRITCEEEQDVTMIDVYGKIVCRKTIKPGHDNTIDVSILSNGVYVLQGKKPGGPLKVVIAH